VVARRADQAQSITVRAPQNGIDSRDARSSCGQRYLIGIAGNGRVAVEVASALFRDLPGELNLRGRVNHTNGGGAERLILSRPASRYQPGLFKAGANGPEAVSALRVPAGVVA
jgi:hypothetical protein